MERLAGGPANKYTTASVPRQSAHHDLGSQEKGVGYCSSWLERPLSPRRKGTVSHLSDSVSLTNNVVGPASDLSLSGNPCSRVAQTRGDSGCEDLYGSYKSSRSARCLEWPSLYGLPLPRRPRGEYPHPGRAPEPPRNR